MTSTNKEINNMNNNNSISVFFFLTCFFQVFKKETVLGHFSEIWGYAGAFSVGSYKFRFSVPRDIK